MLLNRWLKEGSCLNLLIKNWTNFGIITHHADICSIFDWPSLYDAGNVVVFNPTFTEFSPKYSTVLPTSFQPWCSHRSLFEFVGRKRLARICIGCFDRFSKQFPSALNSVSSAMRLHEADTHLVSLLTFTAKVVSAVDVEQAPSCSVMSVPTFSELHLAKVVRVPTTSINRRTDLFSLTSYLVMRLLSACGEPWVENICHLRVVSTTLYYSNLSHFVNILLVLFLLRTTLRHLYLSHISHTLGLLSPHAQYCVTEIFHLFSKIWRLCFVFAQGCVLCACPILRMNNEFCSCSNDIVPPEYIS